jgi:hypothetical protein
MMGNVYFAGAPHMCVQDLGYLHPDLSILWNHCIFGQVGNVELCSRLDQL